jgi:hypothetical protein
MNEQTYCSLRFLILSTLEEVIVVDAAAAVELFLLLLNLCLCSEQALYEVRDDS